MDSESLINEVYILEQVTGHPLFVKRFDVFCEPGTNAKKSQADFYLVFERLGLDLRAVLASAPQGAKPFLCPTQMRVCCLEIAQGLGHLHGLAILHADLKPANVLTYAGKDVWHIKLADFGCSCQASLSSAALRRLPGRVFGVKLCVFAGFVAAICFGGSQPRRLMTSRWGSGIAGLSLAGRAGTQLPSSRFLS